MPKGTPSASGLLSTVPLPRDSGGKGTRENVPVPRDSGGKMKHETCMQHALFISSALKTQVIGQRVIIVWNYIIE